MLYLIGLGLDKKGISLEALEICKKVEKIYLENYTIEFPYNLKELEKVIGKKITPLERKEVESENLVKEASKNNVALLIYGSPLFATTHISLILECIKNNIKYKVLYNASIFDAMGETGLQLYKFGKITSLPSWKENYKPKSFLKVLEENKKINSHTLILVDIGLTFSEALKQLETACKKIKIDKILVCSNLGTKEKKIFYGTIKELKKKDVLPPFCFIIPSKLHFLEEEFLNLLTS